MKVFVISPDKASGDDFCETLRRNGLEVVNVPVKIPPRVVVSKKGRNVLTKDKEGLGIALANAIKKITTKHRSPTITVSCNTLCLPSFVKIAKRHLAINDLYEGKDFKLVTTLNAIHGNKFRTTILLGTSPLVRALDENYMTLLDNEKYKEQFLVQEIIWRVKAVYGDDTSSAPEYKRLDSKKLLIKRVEKLQDSLISLGIKKVILACTELPLAFKLLEDSNGKLKIKTLDPAALVARSIKG